MFYYLVKGKALIRGFSIDQFLGVFTFYFDYPQNSESNKKTREMALALMPLKDKSRLMQCSSALCNNKPFKEIKRKDPLHDQLHNKTIAPPSLSGDRLSHWHIQQCDRPITDAHLKCVLDQVCMDASKRVEYLDQLSKKFSASRVFAKLVNYNDNNKDYYENMMAAFPGADKTTPYFPKEEIEELLESYNKKYPKILLTSYIYFLRNSIYSLGHSAAHGATITILSSFLKWCKFSKTSQACITIVANAIINYQRSNTNLGFLITDVIFVETAVVFLLITILVKKCHFSDKIISLIDIGLLACVNYFSQPETALGVLSQGLRFMWILGISLMGGYMGSYAAKSLITRVGMWNTPRVDQHADNDGAEMRKQEGLIIKKAN